MFTGIIQECPRVVGLKRQSQFAELTLAASFSGDCELGESVAVDGVCLTVTRFSATEVSFDVSRETLERTTIGTWQVGACVNTERSLRVGDRLGGHYVTGHIDGLAKITILRKDADGYLLEVRTAPEFAAGIVQKGSIAINGMSLTVAALPGASRVQVALIPFTFAHTNIQYKHVGDNVNLELDILGKYAQNKVGSGEFYAY